MSSHIDYQRFRNGESCVEEGCRARKFYIADGKKFCQRGHEQTGFTQTQQDEDDWNSQGRKTRKKRQERDPARSVLRGSEARELHLQCYQLILWKQVHWLVKVKDLPAELETVVRDLWSLRLGFFHKSQERSGYSSTTGTVMYSSTSEGDNTDTDGSGFKSASSRRSKKSVGSEAVGKAPKLIETLALLYLGMLLIKMPISLGEISEWVLCDEMVYNRAIKEIPNNMRIRLPISLATSLEVRAPLNGDAFNKAIRTLVQFFHTEFDFVFPALNYPGLLYKYVRNLGLPVEIYPAVQRLASMLKLSFHYDPTSPIGAPSPEVQLVSLIVIATKLCQPFDDIKRYPKDDADPVSVQIDWKDWNSIMEKSQSSGLRKGEAIRVQDAEVMSMSKEALDDYMDWFQQNWLDEREDKMPESILNMFPLSDITVSEPANEEDNSYGKLKRVHQSMLVVEPRFGKAIIRPGERYRRYRREENIPEKGCLLFQIAAEKAGIPLETLLRRVYQLEGRLMQWDLEERRSQAFNLKEDIPP